MQPAESTLQTFQLNLNIFVYFIKGMAKYCVKCVHGHMLSGFKGEPTNILHLIGRGKEQVQDVVIANALCHLPLLPQRLSS